MHFSLVDRVLERTEDRIVTIKHISAAEEYLQDHFPTFPVLPGVLMLEAMVQAARELAGEGSHSPLVLGKVRALKYGTFMQPGSTLRVEVKLAGRLPDGSLDFRGEGRKAGTAVDGGEDQVAVSGRFSLRPVRVMSAHG
ncbi:MAG: polyketide synthase dehydratase domain-containing protein [Phycisphaerae bacterium]|nr:polyketide synthase dehydratase domain-containing protein [Phycisphaerae bacterium]